VTTSRLYSTTGVGGQLRRLC